MSSRSERVFDTLIRTDPGFKTLTNLLYGADVPADAVYDDVFKADGDQPQGGGLLRRIALASTIAGGALAVKETGEGAGVVRDGLKLARTNPVQGKKLALGAAALSGDAITSGELVNKKPPRDPDSNVGKADAGLLEHVKGLVQGAKKATKIAETPNQLSMFDHAMAPATGEAKTVNENKITARAQKLAAIRTNPVANAKQLVNTPGKAAVAATAGTLALQHRPRKVAGMSDQDYYSKRDEPTKDFKAEGTFSKVDADKRLAFGWASVVEKNGLPVVDRQGDYMTLDDVEDAAYRYVISSRIGGDMHKRNGDQPHHVSDLVESMVVTREKLERLGVPADVAKSMPTGWWVGFKIHDDDTWDLVKEGKRAGFSIHGKGRRSLHDLDEQMGY